MQIERVAGFAPQTRLLAETVMQLNEPCIGCKNCEGLCHDLLEMINLPDHLLKGAPA